MPWYEPTTGAPTPLAVERSDEAEVDNYLDEGWNYHPTDDSRNRRHQSTHNGNIRDRLTLDGFQHQVENQLSGIFPLADFSSSLEYTRHTYLSRSTYAGNDDERKDHRNINGKGTSHSKAAQFFHPRPVMALMPYKKDFFSPLTLPSGGQFADVDENRACNDSMFGSNALGSNAELVGYDNRSNLPRQNAFHRQSQYTSTQQQQQYQQREQIQELHHRQQQQSHLQQMPADHSGSDRIAGKIAEPSQKASHNEPTSNLKPKQLNNLFDSFVAKPSKDPFHKPPRQSKLIQDSTTGELVAKSTTPGINSSKHSEKMKTKSWDEYGGRPMDGAGMGSINNSSEGDKAANAKNKKKDKKKSRQDKNQKHPENSMDIGELLQRGTKRSSNHSQEDDGAGKSKDISNAAKSNHGASIETVTELGIPSYNMEGMTMPTSTESPEISETDFDGIERMELQNAAQCMEGLQQFLALVGRQKHVAFTTLFLDPYTGNYFTPSSCSSNDQNGGQRKKKKHAGTTSNKYTLKNSGQAFECTTPFLPTSKKYCTPKGPACSAWNCTCDDQIRGMRASAILLGAMFVFQSGGGGDGMSEDGSLDSGWQCFLLPLGPTTNQEEEVEYERMSTWPTIPFQCDVSLSDRWHAFEALLLNGSTKLVTYNATLSFLPFYYHLDNDVAHLNHASSLASFASCIAGSDLDGSSQYQRCSLRSVWDLRLTSWMLRPEADDATLEFRKFQEGFAHLARDQGQNPKSEMPIIMQGLTDARSNLELIHTLFPIMNEQLSNGGLLDAFECIETPVQSILASMESRGIGFFPHRIKRIEVQIESRIGELETQSRSITNDPEFLLSSPQQVSSFLFDILKLRVPDGIISKTKSGSSHRSTSEEALQGIKSDMVLRTGSSPQMIDIILEFRQLNKLLTTFVRPLPKICRRVPSTRSVTSKRSKNEPSRIYPQWMQTAVRTGRLSCRKPNLQQIPKEGAFGVVPRDAFATKDDMCLFACDYSQKEVRILAHMSGDEAMIALFRGDPRVDIYRQMSSVILNKPADAVTDKERSQFKQITLAILYGMSANQVSTKLCISKVNAQQLMVDFFRRFRGIKTWMDATKAAARSKLCVKTIAGRKRFLDDINSDDNAKRSQAERQAINTVIQGSAADMMKTAMIHLATNLERLWPEETTRPRMLLQIHDEMILEVRLNERDIKLLKDIVVKSCCNDCERFFGLKVPLLLNCSAGKTWGAMKEI